jgi:antitoxin CptB
MVSDENFHRLFWHSRRGMLELDLVLLPFLENHFRQLDEADQQRYEQLLTCEDQDMFSWFLTRVKPEDPDIARIVDLILASDPDRPD